MYSQQWGQPTKKRGRDDDGDVAIGGTEGFTEHRNKRIQSLPFRTSPTSKRLSFPPSFNHGAPPNSFDAPPPPHTITPSDSDSEDANKANTQQNSSLSAWQTSSPTLAVSQVSDNSAFSHAPEMVDEYRIHDVDMDMDMDESGGQAHDSYLGPGPAQPDPMQPGNITSRMPTPIHCSFAAQVRGNNWSGAAGNVMQPTGFGPPPVDRSVPRSLDQSAMTAMADWNMVQNRRLPSPISESGCEDLGRPAMVQRSQLHPGMPPRAASAMDFSTVARTSSGLSTVSDNNGESASAYSSDHPATDSSNGNAMDIEPPATPSPKKGHTRSRHTLNSWTQVPGMKKTFSIGFRADCENKASWRAKKECLKLNWAAFNDTHYGDRGLGVASAPGDNSTVAKFQQSPERRLEPLSDEWFRDLDRSVDEITRLFEELSVAPPEPEGIPYIRQAEAGIDAIHDGLVDCFTTLQNTKHRLSQCDSPDSSAADSYKVLRPRSLDLDLRDGLKGDLFPAAHRRSISSVASLGDAVMEQMFEWWQPRGSSYVRGMPRRCSRLNQEQSTEIEGRMIL